jgi:hypothetical protein
MTTCELNPKTVLGESSTPVAPSVEAAGGCRRRPRRLRNHPKVKNVPQDELGRHLLTLLHLHPHLMSLTGKASDSLEGFASRLMNMSQKSKLFLLGRFERALGIPREEVKHFDEVND